MTIAIRRSRPADRTGSAFALLAFGLIYLAALAIVLAPDSLRAQRASAVGTFDATGQGAD